ncbi:unnamed protein product [Clonostachys rhizophaga]|uniref:Zn(2)-C6 fungal-type domain-containing protein n=1 Tax=Clonostachys rhizophaga TaxID=160324 RepID=A0A9N9VA97_9HYPO|nr:unnamed protein product [Clonostachys rhizophaga]
MDLVVTPSAASASPSTSESTSKSVVTICSGSAEQPRHQLSSKTRLSCDRCHAQKLRCVKNEGIATCRRCLRLKTLCRYSPRATRSSTKPGGQSTHLPQPDHDVTLSTGESLEDIEPVPVTASLGDVDWWVPVDTPIGLVEGQDHNKIPGIVGSRSNYGCTIQGGLGVQEIFSTSIFDSLGDTIIPGNHSSVDWDLIFPNDPIKQTLPLINTPNPPIGRIAQSINQNAGSSLVSTFQKLASLSAQIYECGANLPSPHRSSTRQTHTGYNIGINAAPKSAHFIFDELFRVTTEFIEILGCLPNSRSEEDTVLCTASPGFQLSQSFNSYSQDMPSSDQSVVGGHMASQPWPSSHVDDATAFMIMSCHSSLTETYGSILQMMQMCLEHSLIPQMGSSWLVILPRVQVGSVELPSLQVGDQTPVSSKATSSMYMMTVTMLFSRLWTQLASVLRESAGAKSSTGIAQNSSLVETMWDTALDRTDKLIQTIDSMKSQLHG